MDSIQQEEPAVVRHKSSEKEAYEEPKAAGKLQQAGKKSLEWLGKFTLLEAIGIIAIVTLVLNLLFEINVTVTRKPLLEKLLGSKASQDLPAPLAGGNTEAVPADPALLAAVIPAEGVELPATWGDLGKQMVASGVIDQGKFEALYKERGGLTPDMQKMFLEGGNGKIKITSENSGIVLNLLWALGLGNQNDILDTGEMQDKQYGGAGKFASTGGWGLASGNAMDHYSKHRFIRLTKGEQSLVDKVSRGIFRPCCGNSTHFPDCNHGMAMLALLELMASQGVSEQDMYQAALAVNSYWFPDTYLTIASFFKKQGVEWNKVSPQMVLSVQYSSAQGYQQLLSQITPQQASKSKGGCGV